MKNYFKILVKRTNLQVTLVSFCSNGSFLTWPETNKKKGIRESDGKKCGMRGFREKGARERNKDKLYRKWSNKRRGAYLIIHFLGAALT